MIHSLKTLISSHQSVVAPNNNNNSVTLWHLNVAEKSAHASALNLLSLDEKNLAKHISHKRRYSEYILGRALTRLILSHTLQQRQQDSSISAYTKETLVAPEQLPIITEAFGKLVLPPHYALSFNLSHSNGKAILAVSPAYSTSPPYGQKVAHYCLGVDIEYNTRRRDWQRLAKGVFTENECTYIFKENLSLTDGERRFYRLWTMKEAYMKASGLGLRMAPDSFEILIEEDTVNRWYPIFHPPDKNSVSQNPINRWVRSLAVHEALPLTGGDRYQQEVAAAVCVAVSKEMGWAKIR